MYILHEGTYVDVYTIMQTNRVYDVNRKVLNEFGIKIVFPIDEDDMSKINVPTNIKNRDNSRAIFYDRQNDIYEKFIPYIKPSEEILKFIKSEDKEIIIDGEKMYKPFGTYTGKLIATSVASFLSRVTVTCRKNK